jgi:UDP-N-acetylmuramoylalanine--D-glutamate ligase
MNIGILGGGESGVGAALLAKKKNIPVFLSDKNLIPDNFRRQLFDNQIDFEDGGHTFEKILQASEIIKSPGISEKGELFEQIRAKNIPVISEIEFASRYTSAKIVAITGSNGKTTTTLLTHHLFRKAGLNAGIAGNVGSSFAKSVAENTFDWYVLEVSSFQLDNCNAFHPHIAVLTNITPDHLDRYDYNFQNYTDAKFKIIQQQQAGDFFIYFEDNEPVPTEINKRNIQAEKLNVSLKNTNSNGYVEKENLFVNFNNQSFHFSLKEMPLPGTHNALNALCAILAGLAAGIPPETLREGLKDFQGAAHRLEFITDIQGVTFVNDSKATNVDSVYYALGSFEKPIVWIAGGIDKGNDYKQIAELAKQKIKALICLGTDNEILKTFFHGKIPIIKETQSMVEAVKMSKDLAAKEDVVLLSPACSSFDLFKNYEDRGNQFREAVLNLQK